MEGDSKSRSSPANPGSASPKRPLIRTLVWQNTWLDVSLEGLVWSAFDHPKLDWVRRENDCGVMRRGSLVTMHRQRERESRTNAHLTPDPDLAPMQLDKQPGKRQPETGAFYFLIHRPHLAELFEHRHSPEEEVPPSRGRPLRPPRSQLTSPPHALFPGTWAD